MVVHLVSSRFTSHSRPTLCVRFSLCVYLGKKKIHFRLVSLNRRLSSAQFVEWLFSVNITD